MKGNIFFPPKIVCEFVKKKFIENLFQFYYPTWKHFFLYRICQKKNSPHTEKNISIQTTLFSPPKNFHPLICRVRFIKIRAERPPPVDLVIPKKKKVKDPALAGIRVGNPLPDQGTCKHYRKSTRWFRFPCCSRVFPCDTCHEENNKDGHEMLRANRMLCGFCSR